VRVAISSFIENGETIDINVVHMSMPPTLEATSYCVMYVFRNHLRVSNEEEHLTTNDNGIAVTFEQECVLGAKDQRPIIAKLEYVSWVEEILELNYGVFNTIVFFCNWVKTTYTRTSTTIKIDEYDFTLEDFNSLISISDQSFAFPIHVFFFFSTIPKERGWK
jgi:hypothetical protein